MNANKINKQQYKICVFGLGYVGLPLAHAFSKKYAVTGYDISKQRISSLKQSIDSTNELSKEQLNESIENGIIYTTDLNDCSSSNIYIVTVPTPINQYNIPNLGPLRSASEKIGSILKDNDIVIFESTVYPGATEEFCVPILEKVSNKKFNVDFFCGYSPERINPGDKEHTVSNIKKITSGSNENTALIVDNLYSEIIDAGTHKTSSIKIAEAAKVIENAQRDINIAFINELAILFDKLDINTNEVLKAASTKWNFLNFKPGLVGGHCIGVDPYYLVHKAKEVRYNPEIITAGRRINDNMSAYASNKLIKNMISAGSNIKDAKILVLGITFKENCPDIRNSKVIDMINDLKGFGCNVHVSDCYADSKEVALEYGINLINFEEVKDTYKNYEAILFAVGHKEYIGLDLKTKNNIVFDLKYIAKNADITL